MWLVWLGNTISAMRTSSGGSVCRIGVMCGLCLCATSHANGERGKELCGGRNFCPHQLNTGQNMPGAMYRLIHRPCPSRGSERHVEGDLALHPDLVGRGPALEEISQFLHVLQLHERPRIAP